MKTQRQFLSVAWLAAYALLLLSACRGPAPIAGRATEITAAGVTSNTPLPASTPLPSGAVPTRAVVTEQTLTPTVLVSPTQSPRRVGTATATPVSPNTPDAPTPPATDTPVPDDVKPGRPTETPAVLNITPPEISGYSLQQKPDGGWTYVDKSGKEVAHTATYNWEGLNSKKTMQRGALVVSDEKLMAYLLKTGSEGRGKSEIPLFPLPFNPEGLELQEKKFSGVTVIAIEGRIQEIVQPLPGSRMVLLNNYSGSSAVEIIPNENEIFGFKVTAPSFVSSLLPFREIMKPFSSDLATKFSGTFPPRYRLPGANAVVTAENSKGGLSVTLDDFLSYGGYTVAADH